MKAKTYDRQTAKFLAVVGENMPELSGDVMQGWIENPKAVQKALKNAFCPPEETSRFKVWKTIKIGTGLKTADDFRKALRDNGFRISEMVKDILGKPDFTAASEETEVDLVLVTVAQLGFKEGTRRDQIYKRAQELGLALCPPEVGPQLRLQYQDQPKGGGVVIGMKPIADVNRSPRVFSVGHCDSGPYLNGHCWGHPGTVLVLDERLVFVRPRK